MVKIILIALFFLCLSVITYGKRRSQVQEYGFFNFNWTYAPLFILGISYDRTYPKDGMEVDTFSLGFLIVVIEFNFYRFTETPQDDEETND